MRQLLVDRLLLPARLERSAIDRWGLRTPPSEESLRLVLRQPTTQQLYLFVYQYDRNLKYLMAAKGNENVKRLLGSTASAAALAEPGKPRR